MARKSKKSPTVELRAPPHPSFCPCIYFTAAARPTPHRYDSIFRIAHSSFAGNHSRFFTSCHPASLIISRCCSTTVVPFASRSRIFPPPRSPSADASVHYGRVCCVGDAATARRRFHGHGVRVAAHPCANSLLADSRHRLGAIVWL